MKRIWEGILALRWVLQFLLFHIRQARVQQGQSGLWEDARSMTRRRRSQFVRQMRVALAVMLALLTLSPAQLLAAARTTTAAGDWNTAGTWTGGVKPVSGDTVTISHAVTVSGSEACGTSTTTTPYAKPSATASGGGTSGGTIPTGSVYTFSFTYVAGGIESPPSPATTSTNVTTLGWKPRVTFPTASSGTVLPTGVTSINLYVSGGSAGTPTRKLYATGITTTTYDCTTDMWADGASTYAATATPTAVPEALLVSAGSLTISSGGTLVVKGNLQLANTVLTVNGTLEFDSSGSPTSNAVYDIRCGTAATQTSTLVTCAGSSGAHGIIRSNAGGGVCRIEPTSLTSSTCLSRVDLTYCDLTRVGDATNDGISIQNNTANISIVSMNHCVMDTCGWLIVGNITNPVATSGWTVQNCTWRNSPKRNAIAAIGGGHPTVCTFVCSTTSSNIARLFDHNVLDWQVNVTGGGAVWSNNYLDCGYYPSQAASFPTHGSITGNFIRFVNNSDVNNTDMAAGTNMTYNYIYGDAVTSTSFTNPHFVSTGNGVGNTLDTSHNILEFNGADGSGDCYKTFTGTSTTYTIDYNIILPNGANDINGANSRIGSGGLITCFNTTPIGARLLLRHNTMFQGAYAGSINEGGDPGAGIIDEFYDNLAWADPGVNYGSQAGPYLITGTSFPISANALNPFTSGKIDFNAMLNAKDNGYAFTTYSNAKYYNVKQSTAVGASDVTLANGAASTVFVDDTRNFKKWCISLGYSGTNTQVITAGLAALRAMNEPANGSYNAAATITASEAYIRAGFLVKVLALKDAGHDGITIGSQAYQSSASIFRRSPDNPRAGSRGAIGFVIKKIMGGNYAFAN